MTPASLAAWEADTFPALRRHRDVAASTIVDDELPDDPQNHLDELRSALDRLPPA